MSATEARKEFGPEVSEVTLTLTDGQKWNKFILQVNSSYWSTLKENIAGKKNEDEECNDQQPTQDEVHRDKEEEEEEEEETLNQLTCSIEKEINKKLADENRMLRLKIEILMDLVRIQR